jgi:hypothetical protein
MFLFDHFTKCIQYFNEIFAEFIISHGIASIGRLHKIYRRCTKFTGNAAQNLPRNAQIWFPPENVRAQKLPTNKT